jgi:hypothetical protein
MDGTTDLIAELRDAAGWVDHQMDPAPDWDGLLATAADEIEALRSVVRRLQGHWEPVRFPDRPWLWQHIQAVTHKMTHEPVTDAERRVLASPESPRRAPETAWEPSDAPEGAQNATEPTAAKEKLVDLMGALETSVREAKAARKRCIRCGLRVSWSGAAQAYVSGSSGLRCSHSEDGEAPHEVQA